MKSGRGRSRKDSSGQLIAGVRKPTQPSSKISLPKAELEITGLVVRLGEHALELARSYGPAIAARCAEDPDYCDRITFLSPKLVALAAVLRFLQLPHAELLDSRLSVEVVERAPRPRPYSRKVH